MKKEILIGAAAFFLLSLNAMSGVYAVEENLKTVTIARIKKDITGDGKNEVIALKGVPFQNQAKFFKEIFLEINAPGGKSFKFPLESGEGASIRLADLNDDSIKDVFVTVYTGGKSNGSAYYLFTLKDFKPAAITVPDPLKIEGRFLKGYKASVMVQRTNKTYAFDLHKWKHYYDQTGIYQEGILNESAELAVSSYRILIPERIKGGKPGLKGVQKITGAGSDDMIAYMESFWVLDKGKWQLVQTDVGKGTIKN